MFNNTHPNIVNVQRHRPNTIQYPPKTFPRHYLCTNWSQQKQAAPTDTPWHPQTLPGVVWGWLKPESVCWRHLVSVGMCWLLLLSGYVLLCRRWGWGGGYGCIWVMFMGIWGVCRCLEGYIGAHPLNGGELILFWHSPEKPNCFHQAKLRHQNVHIQSYILNKNGWVL